MIFADFLSQITLITFLGDISYDVNGYAVFPTYNSSIILASVQTLPSSAIRYLPEGTHYQDFYDIFTDELVSAGSTAESLLKAGNWYIWDDKVYKIYSDNNYKNFTALSTNHIKQTIKRDHRMKWDKNTNTININFPEIDNEFNHLFDLIKIVPFCISQDPFLVPISTLWSFQQEFRPEPTYCVVNIVGFNQIEQTNFNQQAGNLVEQKYYSKQMSLDVDYYFVGYDKVQLSSYVNNFQLFFENFVYTNSTKISYGGVRGELFYSSELYENREVHNCTIPIRFSIIVETIKQINQINTIITNLTFNN
jgi:hypothetical protein